MIKNNKRIRKEEEEYIKNPRIDYKELEFDLIQILKRNDFIYHMFQNDNKTPHFFHTIKNKPFAIYAWHKSIDCQHKNRLSKEIEHLNYYVEKNVSHYNFCRLIIKFKRNSGTITELYTGFNHFFGYSYDTGIVSLNDIPTPRTSRPTHNDFIQADNFVRDLIQNRPEKLAIYFKLLEIDIFLANKEIELLKKIMQAKNYIFRTHRSYTIDPFNIIIKKFIYDKLYIYLVKNFNDRIVISNDETIASWEYGTKKKKQY